jgi:signal transduction histidine kinase
MGWLRFVVGVRVCVAAAAAAVGSFGELPSDRATAVAYVVQFGWLPLATLLAFAAQRPPALFTRYVGPLSDLAVAAVATAVFNDMPLIALLGAAAVTAQALVWWYELPVLAGPVVAAVVSSVAIAAEGWSASSALAVLTLVVLVGAEVLIARVYARREDAAVRTRAALLDRADTITSAVPHPILVTDAAGRLRQWNPAAGRLLPDDADVGSACEHALGLHLGERQLSCADGCPLLSLCQEGESVEVWQAIAGDSTRRRPVLASAAAVSTGDPGETEVVHSLRDITQLKQADEAKTLFLATASHELKTPLTVIRGFSDMLIKHPDLPADRRLAALDAVNRRARDLAAIVDRILLSSRIEAGRLTLTTTSLKVTDLVTERCANFAEATGRSVDVDVDSVPPVLANEAAVTTVLDHLLDNAAKYAAAPTPIAVGVRELPAGVALWVSDEGVGMDDEQVRHCFDKFWQADSSDSREHGGTGIGLYIVRSLVEAMGGSIEVDSAPGRGSTFTFVLPRVADGVPAQRGAPGADEPVPEPSMVREFMKQLGLSSGGSR